MGATTDGTSPTERAGPPSVRPAAGETYTGRMAEVPADEVAKDMGEDEGSEMEFGSTRCECTECGAVVPHERRGIPCSQLKCPKCGAPMHGRQCRGE